MQSGDKFTSVDSRRPRTVEVVSVSEDGLSAKIKNEGTGRITTVKASRLTSHGGYKPVKVNAPTPADDPQQS